MPTESWRSQLRAVPTAPDLSHQPRAPDRSGHSRSQWSLPDHNCKRQISVQYRAPTARARSQWALLDLTGERKMSHRVSDRMSEEMSDRMPWWGLLEESISSIQPIKHISFPHDILIYPHNHALGSSLSHVYSSITPHISQQQALTLSP